jgi:hypothetical protein
MFLSIAAVTFGQEKQDDLKKLFELMNSAKTIDNIMDNMMPILKEQASSQIKGTDAGDKLNKYMDFVMNEVKELSKKVVNEEMIPLYDKHFTQDEIKELIRFYESPTGKKLIQVTPELTKELMEKMSKHIPAFQKKLQDKLMEYSAQ